jgi:hypothetical protein
MFEITDSKRQWATTLCDFDPESCILAHVLPCHIYAKVSRNCYLFNFIYYGLFTVAIYNCGYWLNYINSNRCPSLVTNQCIGLRENCSDYFIIVDGSPAKCIIMNDFCVHSESSCFTNYKKLNMVLSLAGSVSYFILCLLHYFLREKVKKEHNIIGEYDACAVTLCSQCGLAQEYREIEPVGDIYMNV